MLVVEPVRERSRRERLRADLSFLGYAPLSETTWIGPRPSPELDPLLDGRASAPTGSRRCSTAIPGRSSPEPGIWTASGRPTRSGWSRRSNLVGGLPQDAAADQVFATRSRLLHGWRNFLFRDPGLPAELLPPGWPGEKARLYFEREATRLLPAAAAFVDRHLTEP